jgi:3-isopropylmalate dehydrogenase
MTLMKARIAILPGDGIGPEVMDVAVQVLDRIAARRGHEFDLPGALIGGRAIDETGTALPDETLRICESANAILLAAVGGPKWDDPSASVRPELGLLALRKHFGLFANLRPVKAYPALAQHVPLRADLLDGVDLLFVRELTGGLYFGPRKEQGDGQEAYDTMLYTTPEVERVAHVAFRAAQRRRKKATSVDKANILASMRLWRSTVMKVHEDYADVELDHLLVDACTMHLLTRPASFDVILAGNMFGDILSDEASVLAGSLGMLASASLGEGTFGLYEPVHGSAPDIVGQGKANPIAMILSTAMMLRYSLGLDPEADAIEQAVEQTLEAGARTADIASAGGEVVSTGESAGAVMDNLDNLLAAM